MLIVNTEKSHNINEILNDLCKAGNFQQLHEEYMDVFRQYIPQKRLTRLINNTGPAITADEIFIFGAILKRPAEDIVNLVRMEPILQG